jgi:hypothetical protein
MRERWLAGICTQVNVIVGRSESEFQFQFIPRLHISILPLPIGDRAYHKSQPDEEEEAPLSEIAREKRMWPSEDAIVERVITRGVTR